MITAKFAKNAKQSNNILCELCVLCGEFRIVTPTGGWNTNVKKRNIFGLERKVSVTKSGNSLVIRIPPEIAEFLGFHYKSKVQLFPVDKDKLEIKIVS